MGNFVYFAQLFFEAAVGIFGVRLYEEPRYQTLAQLPDGVEVRRYEPRLAAETTLPDAGGTESADRAFKLLFNYIAGANRGTGGSDTVAMTMPVEVTGRGGKVAMTVPVETAAVADGIRMRFFLPSRLTLGTAPQPGDPRVVLVEVPAETVATLRFAGTPDETELARRREALLAGLEHSPWHAIGSPVTLYYDAPFTLPFLRRNEAAVTVAPQPGRME